MLKRLLRTSNKRDKTLIDFIVCILVFFLLGWYVIVGTFLVVLTVFGLAIGYFLGWEGLVTYVAILVITATLWWVADKLAQKRQK